MAADRSLLGGAEPCPRREEAPEWGYEEGEGPGGLRRGQSLGGRGGLRCRPSVRLSVRPVAPVAT